LSSKYIDDISKDYALYVLDNRGIPYVADGLKNVQRIALWVMKNQNTYAKVSEVVGRMAEAKLYNHGEDSANAAISRLAAIYVNNIPLIEGKGAFGTRVSPIDSIGAPRYISVKKSNAAEKLLYIDIDIAPLRPNYDGSSMMPKHFLPLIPLILLNGISGIATGWSTEILPRNITDLIDATINAIDKKEIKHIIPYWHNYDLTVNPIEENRYEVIGKFTRINSSKILVTELPPSLDRNKFVEILENIVDPEKPKENYISPIKEYIDESSKGINFEIRFARGLLESYSDEDINKLLRLRTTYTERVMCINWDNKPTVYSNVNNFIKEYVQWRFTWYKKRYENLLIEENKNLVYLLSLYACYESRLSDEFVKTKSKFILKDIIKKIVEDTELPYIEENGNKIADMAGYKWTLDGKDDTMNKINESLTKIEEYEKIIADEILQWQIYRSEVIELKKYFRR